MDALEALRDHRAHAQQDRALGRPVARRAGAVFLAGEDHQRRAVVLDRPSPRRRSPSARRSGHVVKPPSTPGDHLVLDADIGEGAAHHHFVIAAARAVGVEVARRHLPLAQILAGRRTAALIEPAGEMWSVVIESPEQRQHAWPLDVGDRRRRHRHALEIGRVLHIGRAGVPLIGLAAVDGDALPVLVALEHVGVARAEHFGVTCLRDDLGDLLRWSARCP